MGDLLGKWSWFRRQGLRSEPVPRTIQAGWRICCREKP